MSFLARLVSDNSGSLEKLELGHRPPQPPLRKQFLHGVRVLVRGYLRVRFDLLIFRYISDFLKLGAHNPYYGSPRGPREARLDSTNIIAHYSSIVPEVVFCTVSETLPSTCPTSLYLVIALAFYSHRRGSPGTTLVKFCVVVSGWLGYKMAQKHC